MPTYDYHCDACNHDFEVFEPITAQPQKKCPKCKKSKLRRLFGAGAGLIFKGSGFYKTDYRSDSYKKSADAEKPTTESSGSSSTAESASPKSEKPEKSSAKKASAGDAK